MAMYECCAISGGDATITPLYVSLEIATQLPCYLYEAGAHQPTLLLGVISVISIQDPPRPCQYHEPRLPILP